MFEVILANPAMAIVTVLIAVVSFFIGKLFFSTKEENHLLQNQMCASQLDVTNAINNVKIEMSTKAGELTEKIRIVQKDTLDEADRKYFTKEMAKRHDDRIEKLEILCAELKENSSKIPLIYSMVEKMQEKIG